LILEKLSDASLKRKTVVPRRRKRRDSGGMAARRSGRAFHSVRRGCAGAGREGGEMNARHGHAAAAGLPAASPHAQRPSARKRLAEQAHLRDASRTSFLMR
jgi:hypothetical protein